MIHTLDENVGATVDRGPYQQLASGKPFFLLDPRAREVAINDIAVSLGNKCRFAGHCKPFYSVAQHSVHVSHLVPSRLALWGLLHDGSEAYSGDITRPMKVALEIIAPGALAKIVEPIERAVAQRFGLDWDWVISIHKEIKAADMIALATERKYLMVDSDEVDWGELPEPDSGPFVAYRPQLATHEFLLRFDDIMQQDDHRRMMSAFS